LVCATLLFGLGTLGCGAAAESDEGDGGITPRPDAKVWEDARTLPDASPVFPEDCSRLDLFVQSECGGSRRCTVVSGNLDDASGDLGCAPPGEIPPLSACTQTLPNGADDCQAGSVCADPYGMGTATCHSFCERLNSYCPDGICLEQVQLVDENAVYLCIPTYPCDPLVLEDGCESVGQGMRCYWSPEARETTCLPEGPRQVGGECSSIADCEPYATCYGEPGDRRCRWTCSLTGGWDCYEGQICVDVGDTDYGVCYGEQTPP
jgi:hypothetical protein